MTMLDRVRDMAIKQKLMTITMFTAVVALITACVAFAITESAMFRRSVLHETNAMAQLIGRNSVAALEFDDPRAAEETLETLAAKTAVRGAAIYAADGRALASYRPDPGTDPLPAPPGHRDLQRFEDGRLHTFRSVTFDGQYLGTVFIETDLSELYRRLERLFVNAGIVLLVSTSLAFGLSSRLQALISEPITSLVRTVDRVSRQKDYSVRAVANSRDELGALIQGFNGMLDQIQSREEELSRARDQLELRVEARTEQLRQEIRVRRGAEAELREAHDQLEGRVRERTAQLAEANESLREEVSERRRAEQALDSRNRDLETLLHVTSHDLREPLRAIRNFSRIVNDRYATTLDSKGQDYLFRVMRATERLDRLIEDILMLSRAQRMDAQTEQVNGRNIVVEVIKRLEATIEEKSATVRMSTEFPDYMVSPMWATQAVYNLVANAIKFSRGDEPPEVEISPYRPEMGADDVLGVLVADRGPGVDADQTEKIFGLFKRAHGREVEGTGAGLAIVRQIAERHGGRAWVEPREGGGSRFIVTFAAQPAEDGATCTKVG